MSLDNLLYKGKPYLGANRIADKVPAVCFCRFVAVGEPMDATKCEVHAFGTKKFQCMETRCLDYRPNSKQLRPNHWPRCVCGEIAQMH